MNAVDGALVEFEVARMQDVARSGLHEHAHGARDGMVHREEIDDETAQLDFVARLDLCKLGLHAMLVELALDQAERHFCSVNRHLAGQVFHQVRQRARMILVAVGDDDAAQLMLVFEHISIVGKNQIDARVIVVGKHQARVDEQHVVAAFEHGHVLADGVEAAQRDDLEFGGRILLHARTTTRAVRGLRGVARTGLGEAFLLHLVFRRHLRALMLDRDGLMARRVATTAILAALLGCRAFRIGLGLAAARLGAALSLVLTARRATRLRAIGRVLLGNIGVRFAVDMFVTQNGNAPLISDDMVAIQTSALQRPMLRS